MLSFWNKTSKQTFSLTLLRLLRVNLWRACQGMLCRRTQSGCVCAQTPATKRSVEQQRSQSAGIAGFTILTINCTSHHLQPNNAGQSERHVLAFSEFGQMWVFMAEIKESPQGVIWKQWKVTGTINRLLYLVMKAFSQACSWVITNCIPVFLFFLIEKNIKTNQDLKKHLGASPWATRAIPGTLKYKT